MRSRLSVLLFAGILSAGASLIRFSPARALAPAPAPPRAAAVELPVPPEQVVSHVSRSITWYRRINALQQIPVDSDDIVPRYRLSQTALTSLQLAFEFGHAAGAMASTSQPATDSSDADSQGSAIDRAAARMADRITSLQAQLTALGQQISHAAAKDKEALVAKRAEVSAALDLAKELQGTVGQIQKFEATSDAHAGGASGGLAAQIADLRKSVPEVHGTGGGTVGAGAGAGAGGGTAAAPKPSTPASASSGAETFRPESAAFLPHRALRRPGR